MPRKLSVPAVVLVLAATSATAHAERPRSWTWETGLSLWLGSVNLDHTTMSGADHNVLGIGTELQLGARRGRWRLGADLGYLAGREQDGAMPLPDPLRGDVLRAGGSARYMVRQFRNHGGLPEVGGELWFEAGVGEQLVARDRDDHAFSRGDVRVGIGGGMTISGQRRFHFAYYYALTALFTRERTVDGRPEVCAGPCDTATRPIPIDSTILFTTGIIFGG